jgi:2-hydroxychromene-2-carboxylate isomerase
VSTAETIDFFYDFSSPYTYLASTQIERVAREHGAQVRWRPMVLGALFKTIGTPIVPVETFSEPKRRYVSRDLVHWADHWQVPFHWPSRFPMRTVASLRLMCAIDTAHAAALAHAIFRAFWVDDQDISDLSVLQALVAKVGAPADALARIETPEIKQALITATDAAVRAGVCGAPSFVVRGHLFWGQDRLDLVARTLDGWEPPDAPTQPR